MSAWTYRRLTARPPKRLFRLVLESHDGRAPGADSEEKHEPVSDIDTVVVDSLKALDPEWPIREADNQTRYSITSSASARSRSGTVSPSALAAFKLITSSNLVDCITGRSAGFSPLRMRPVRARPGDRRPWYWRRSSSALPPPRSDGRRRLREWRGAPTARRVDRVGRWTADQRPRIAH